MPPTIDDPVRNLLPTFAAPTMTDLGQGTPEDPDPSPEPPPIPRSKTRRLLPDGAVGPDGPTGPRLDDEPTHTVISSASKPSPKDTTDLLVGLIALAAVGAAALVKWRLGRKLRTPTSGQSRDIAAPLARLALRHFDASWLNKDLADLLQAGAATGAYANDGPLLLPLHPDAGVPDNLQEYDE